MNANQRAKELFIHYFRTLYEKVGLKWDADNDEEIEEAINSILDTSEDLALEHCGNMRRIILADRQTDAFSTRKVES